jgi:superfamily II DNA/RNA helicase
MPPAISRLADRFLKDPERIEVARPATMAENVETWLVPASSESKRRALVKLIGQQGVGKAIVFSNRKRDVSSLCRYLQQSGLNARDIHGDLEQSHRQATLDAFKADQVDFLIATDVAARGLDISDMPVVINFDVPFSPDDYVHRIGRTGRAGKKGRAFTFATADEGRQVGAIERLTGKPIARLEIARGDEEQEEVQEERAPRPRRESSRRPAGQRAERHTDSAHRPERAAEPPADRRATHARSSSGRAQPSRTPAPPRPTPMIDGAPILAFGDHVPSFMLRAVPIAAPKKAEVESEAA